MIRTPRSSRHRNEGFTLAELVIAVSIAGIVATLGIPSFGEWTANQRLDGTARSVGMLFSYARTEAIKTGNIHLVFFGQDADENPLVGPNGNNVSVLVIDDGRPGVSNCAVDPGEAVIGISLGAGVAFGNAGANAPVATDGGGGPMIWLMSRK